MRIVFLCSVFSFLIVAAVACTYDTKDVAGGDYNPHANKVSVIKSLADCHPTTEDNHGNMPVGVPAFDSLNRVYVIDHEEDGTSVSGIVHRLDTAPGPAGEQWSSFDFMPAIVNVLRDEFGPDIGGNDVCFDAADVYTPRLVFDQDDHAYTIARVARCGYSNYRVVLLHSADLFQSTSGAATWTGTVLKIEEPGEEIHPEDFSIELPHSPNAIEGPPAILLYKKGGRIGFCDGTDTSAWHGPKGRLWITKPQLNGGSLSVPEPAEVTTYGEEPDAMSVATSSGNATQVITNRGRLYVAWSRSIPVDTENCASIGSPTAVAVYEYNAQTQTFDQTQINLEVVRTKKTNDGHNIPGIVMGSDGTLHLMAGAHYNNVFKYIKTEFPRDVSQWSAAPQPASALGTSYARQAYVGMVRSRDNTLHLISRNYWETDNPYRWALEYQSLAPGGSQWSVPIELAGHNDRLPSWTDEFYHNIAIDHFGNIHVVHSFFSKDPALGDCFSIEGEDGLAELRYTRWDALSGENPTWITSVNESDLQNLTRWEPTHTLAGNFDGTDDTPEVAQVIWKDGLHVHLASPLGGVSRMLHLSDGNALMQYPTLPANIDGDGADDLIFVFRPSGGALTLRSKELQNDGSVLQKHVTDWSDGSGIPGYAPLSGNVYDENSPGDDIVLLYRNKSGFNIRTKRSLLQPSDTLQKEDSFQTRTVTGIKDVPVDVHNYPIYTGDVDRNGIDDLIFVHQSGAQLEIITKISDGAGGWRNAVKTIHYEDPVIHSFPHLVGNVLGDNNVDIIFMWRSGDTLYTKIKQGLGGGTFSSGIEQSHADGDQVHGYATTLADVNGDGYDDLIFSYRKADEYWYRIRYKLSTKDGRFGVSTEFQVF